MSEAPDASPGSDPRGRHGIGEEWLSFELRMRRRRAATCLQGAVRALEEGRLAEARAALDEALALAPDSHEVAAVEHRLAGLTGPGAAVAPVSVRSDTPRSRRRGFASTAAALALLGMGGIMAAAVWHWDPRQSSETTTPEERTAGPAPDDMPAADSAERLTIVHETIVAKQAAPRLLPEALQVRVETAAPRPPLAEPERTAPAEPPPTEPAVVRAVNRASPGLPLPGELDVRSEVRTEGLPVQALASPPAAALPPPEVEAARAPSRPAVSSTPAEPDVRTTAPAGAATAPPDESIVLDVLERYELAYSRLDADAATAVWPKVNRGALARAFDGLASQRVSLGACDVAIDGAAAQATCSGTATWEPKIGGGVRTEARRWNFELRKSGGAWRIERATAH